LENEPVVGQIDEPAAEPVAENAQPILESTDLAAVTDSSAPDQYESAPSKYEYQTSFELAQPAYISDLVRHDIEPAESATTLREKVVSSVKLSQVKGVVTSVDQDNRRITLRFPEHVEPTVGTKVKVYHDYLFSTEMLGWVEIIGVN